MSTAKTEGIILHALNFKEYDQILTVFSPERGIQKFFFKGGQSTKRKKGSSSAPLTRAEFIYREKSCDLLSCIEISPLSYYQGVRKNLESLEVACKMIKAIQLTQQPGKPAPHLYALLLKYLETLSTANHPEALASSFFLKLLRHEGLLDSLSHCSICRHPLKTLFLSGGEGLCKEHASENSFFFDEYEQNILKKLSFSRIISEISNLNIPDTLQKKVEKTLISLAQ